MRQRPKEEARPMPKVCPLPELSNHEVRTQLGRPLIHAAAAAGTSPTTVRVFEIDPTKVQPAKGVALARLYAQWRAELATRGE